MFAPVVKSGNIQLRRNYALIQQTIFLCISIDYFLFCSIEAKS